MEKKKTSIGGSALIEGVMMRGPKTLAMAVRKPNGEIDLTKWEMDATSGWYRRIPIVRGVFGFIDSMRLSYRCLMKSAELAGWEDEEPSRLEKWLKARLGDRFGDFFSGLAMVLGILLAVALFMVLPTALIGLARGVVSSRWVLSLIEAVAKITIFLAYIYWVSHLEEIRRVFEYHGAEHKTIACYEAGEELTTDNVAKHSRFHPRCGTSFLLITVILSVLVFSLVTWESIALRIAIKLLCLPIVVGFAYELMKLTGRSDNPIARLIALPGLYLQRMTTREPDREQMECAIAAMKPCIPENQELDRW